MAKPTEKSHRSISRRLPGGDKKRGLRKHTKLVGEVVWAWNELQLGYAFAFAWAVNEPRPWVGQAIWSALNNDGAQRDALDAVLVFLGKPGLRKRFHWALKETGKLARYRNDIVHAAMIWQLTDKGLRPTFDHFGNQVGRILRYVDRETHDGYILEGPDLQKLMVFLRGDLIQLAEYVGELSRLIVAEKPSPLPRKPQLRARKFAEATETKTRSPKRRQGRGNPPKPSLG